MNAEQLFKVAYDYHYKSHLETEKAEIGYNRVVELYPDSPEAGYARSQLVILKQDKTMLDRRRTESEKQDPQVILTTSQTLEGYKVIKTIDIISAECVFGMNIFRDFFAAVSDIFGGRSKATQNVLRDARKTCLTELRREAESVGANAVIAVNLDYSEFSGGGKSMLFLVATGTAVCVEKLLFPFDEHTK